jgi:hypothetical protein
VAPQNHAYVWLAPQSCEVGATPLEFLHQLSGPCWILLPGRDRSRSRVLATLLHGNEPSGLIAIHRFIKAGIEPAVDIHIFFGSVATAKTKPLFSNRFLPGHRDLNRCFKPPFDDTEGKVAERMLRYLDELQPECLVDIHNTSGSGPEFSVAPIDNAAQRSLTKIFTHRMIVTELRLGALMEITTPDFAALTVECGGANEQTSHEIAYDGILRYFTSEQVTEEVGESPIFEIFDEPLRFELADGTVLRYGEGPVDDADITIPSNIENYNFGDFSTHEILGWLEHDAFYKITIKDIAGVEQRDKYFDQRDGCLFAKSPLRLFMATTRADIALTDCLFYFVTADQATDRSRLE